MTGTETETTFTLPTVESSKIWSGDSADFAAVTDFTQTVASNVNVNISVFSNFPNLQIVFFALSNKITGTLLIPFNLLQLSISGTNTISGNLELINFNKLQIIAIAGNNTISGNLQNVDFKSLVRLQIFGNNTISGNLSLINFKLLNWFNISGINTISGDLAAINAVNLIYFRVLGNNTINAYSNSTNNPFASSMRLFELIGTGVMPRADVDRLLTKLAAVVTWTNERLVRIQGNHASPTPGLPAIATLQSKGVTVLVNP